MNQAGANALLKIAAYFEGLEERILLDARQIEEIERGGRTARPQRKALSRDIEQYNAQVEAFHASAMRFVDHPMWERLSGLSRRLRP